MGKLFWQGLEPSLSNGLDSRSVSSAQETNITIYIYTHKDTLVHNVYRKRERGLRLVVVAMRGGVQTYTHTHPNNIIFKNAHTHTHTEKHRHTHNTHHTQT